MRSRLSIHSNDSILYLFKQIPTSRITKKTQSLCQANVCVPCETGESPSVIVVCHMFGRHLFITHPAVRYRIMYCLLQELLIWRTEKPTRSHTHTEIDATYQSYVVPLWVRNWKKRRASTLFIFILLVIN